jgi:DNA modification methylase
MTEFYNDGQARLLLGDCRDVLATLPERSVHCCVTSPPYFSLRDYGYPGQIGLEPTLPEYIAALVNVFRAVRRVLRDDGTLWLNIGDSYNGSGGAGGDYAKGGIKEGQPKYPGRNDARLKPKDLMMVPARLALALQDDGWWIRSHIVWSKTSCMPESVTDRPTSAWESIFLLAKSERYFYDTDAVRQPHSDPNVVNGVYQGKGGVNRPDWIPDPKDGLARSPVGMRNREYNAAGASLRNVWTLGPEPTPFAHFATFPTEIPRRAIAAGTSERGVCPACGAPWGRVVERKAMVIDRSEWGRGAVPRTAPSGTMVEPPQSVTVGWEPSCNCNAGEPIPATVLDPFIGSGTSCLAAKRLGRRSIGVDASQDYLEIARGRIGQLALMPMDVGASGHRTGGAA